MTPAIKHPLEPLTAVSLPNEHGRITPTTRFVSVKEPDKEFVHRFTGQSGTPPPREAFAVLHA